MRKLTSYANEETLVPNLLDKLSNKETLSTEYAKAFYDLGVILSSVIKKNYKLENSNITISCSSEDADWLSKGIMDNLPPQKLSLAVFWNVRTNPFKIKEMPIAPIIKSYIEKANRCDILIICKSIIYTSCVVRTNLLYLIEDIRPSKILIVSPVIYVDAENILRKEFPSDISSMFDFIYFAEDDEVNSEGEIIPGIGGLIYQRLGLNDTFEKNKYIPEIVKERRLRRE